MTTWVYVVVALAVVATIIFHKRLLALFANGGGSENLRRYVPHTNLPGVSPDALPVYSPQRERRHAELFEKWYKEGWSPKPSDNPVSASRVITRPNVQGKGSGVSRFGGIVPGIKIGQVATTP